jgi:hypothetical protein
MAVAIASGLRRSDEDCVTGSSGSVEAGPIPGREMMGRGGGVAFEETALAAWVAEVGFAAIPARIRAHAVDIVRDTLGVILRGAQAPEVQRLVAAFVGEAAPRDGDAPYLGCRRAGRSVVPVRRMRGDVAAAPIYEGRERSRGSARARS